MVEKLDRFFEFSSVRNGIIGFEDIFSSGLG